MPSIDAHDAETPLDKITKNVNVETSMSKAGDEEGDESEIHEKSSNDKATRGRTS